MSAPCESPRVHWLIQANHGAALDVQAMADALTADGQVPHLVQLARGEPIPDIPELPDQAPIVCHGPGFLTRAVGHPRFSKGLFFDDQAFRWSTFREHWGEAMLAPEGRLSSLAEAQAELQKVEKAFVRPDEDSKVFDGGVFDAPGLLAKTRNLPSVTPVIVAAPRVIDAEWRFFIVDKEVVGCSEYRRWGEPSMDGYVPHRAIDLAADLIQHWGPAPVYCLDLAMEGDRIGVVEANCFNAARFYGADAGAVLNAVSAFRLANRGG